MDLDSGTTLKIAEQEIVSILRTAIPTISLPVIVVTDIAKDYDDMAALLVLAALHRLDHITLKAVVTNLMPAAERAKVARRTLDLLGLSDVRVGIGMSACVKEHPANEYEFSWETDHINAMRNEDFDSGDLVLHDAYIDAQKAQEKISLVLISSLSDINDFARNHQDLFSSTTGSILMQGSNQLSQGTLVPHESSPAANNLFDPEAAKEFHALIQKLNIPSTTFTKHAAYAIPLPDDTFRELAATGTSIGRHLEWLHFEITKKFYEDSRHNRYKADLTPEVILETRTTWYDSHEADAELPKPEELRPYLKRPILYDAIAGLGVLGDDVLNKLASVGKEMWGPCHPFTPDMRGGIHGEVGCTDEAEFQTFHPGRVALLLITLMKVALREDYASDAPSAKANTARPSSILTPPAPSSPSSEVLGPLLKTPPGDVAHITPYHVDPEDGRGALAATT